MNLSLSDFKPVFAANHNNRFHIDQQGKVAAAEGFLGRLMSSINLSSVKEQNSSILSAFAEAIGNNDPEKTTFVKYLLAVGNTKALTSNVAKYVRDKVTERFSSDTGAKTVTAEIKDYAANESSSDKLNRFKNIKVAEKTQIQVSTGFKMPANEVTVGGKPAAVAGSYPKDTSQAMEMHFRMLVEKDCSALVVLAGNDQIFEGTKFEGGQKVVGLPAYFRGTHDYDGVNVKSRYVSSHSLEAETPELSKANPKILSGPLVVDKYVLTITVDGQTFTKPVLHATNWPDHGTLQDASQLMKLSRLVEGVIDQSESQGLPMIHCKGGVGRTGTLVVGLAQLKNPYLDVDVTIKELQDTRSKKMCEDIGQVNHLKEMKNILISDNSDSQDDLYANGDEWKSSLGSQELLCANSEEFQPSTYANAGGKWN